MHLATIQTLVIIALTCQGSFGFSLPESREFDLGVSVRDGVEGGVPGWLWGSVKLSFGQQVAVCG